MRIIVVCLRFLLRQMSTANGNFRNGKGGECYCREDRIDKVSQHVRLHAMLINLWSRPK